MDKMVQKPNYVEELLEILRSSLAADELQDQISDYHESDIADAFEQLTEEERKRLYPLLGRRNGLLRFLLILKIRMNI